MPSKKNASKKGKKSAKPRKKAAPKKAVPVLRGATPCVCDIATDGKYYCFKKEQGRWKSCRGPFDSLEECQTVTGETCG